jgi:transposase
MEIIAFDSHKYSHKYYTLASVEDAEGRIVCERRIAHKRGAVLSFLSDREPGSPVAVETIGNWSWIVDEIEAAGMVPRLVHARKAKLMMGMLNKTDRLDVRGLNRLQRTGTLPVVWIPPGELRDLRELPRTRMVLTRQRTQLKNRIQATLAKHALELGEASDHFGKRGLSVLRDRVSALPPQASYATARLLRELVHVSEEITRLEARIRRVMGEDSGLALLKTVPGVGDILGVVLVTEIGAVERFASAAHLASYAGTTPRVHASGGKTRMGQLRGDVNRYLKWAYVEAANVNARHHRRTPDRHVSRLYGRLRARRGHPKAIGAVARHLAEASFHILSNQQPYRDPAPRQR